MNTYTLEKLKESILPLCHGYQKPVKSIKTTLGNTIIFKYGNGVWLLTCRHLMETAWSENMIKSVMLAENANYFLMWEQNDHLLFHPADTKEHTLDLALYYFSRVKSFEIPGKLWNWEAGYRDQTLRENDPLKIIGIRSEQMTPESVVSSNPVRIEEIDGSYLENTIDVSPEDYDRKLVKQQIARVKKTSLMELAGGLVAARGDHGWYPRGIITGTGTVTLKTEPESPAEETGIYTFTDLSHLQGMLNPASKNSF